MGGRWEGWLILTAAFVITEPTLMKKGKPIIHMDLRRNAGDGGLEESSLL